MLKGDIDNTPSYRWLITLEALTDGGGVPPKKRGRLMVSIDSWTARADRTVIHRDALGYLWQFTNRVHVTFELVCFGANDEYCHALQQRIDEMGVHPIRYVNPYKDRHALREELPYRPEVQAVVDTPDLAFHWGLKGMSLQQAVRVHG